MVGYLKNFAKKQLHIFVYQNYDNNNYDQHNFGKLQPRKTRT